MVTNSLKNTDKEGQTGLCYGLLAPSEQARPLRWGGICRFNPLYSWNNLQLTFYSFLSQSEFLGQCSDGGCSTPISLCWPGISKISSVKGETAVNTFCFVSHTVSVTTTQLSAVCSTKAARAIGKWMEGAVFWFSLIYKNRVQAIFGPQAITLLISDLHCTCLYLLQSGSRAPFPSRRELLPY